MSDDPHSRGGPPTHVMAGAGEPTHGERVRTLMAGRTDGTLSTIALDPSGYPFGSIVTFALADDGAPLILMSTMAEHARNLDADGRASLMVTAAGEGAGRLAVARATLVGTVSPVPADQQAAATEAYMAVHPDAFWARFPDFGVRRLDVEAIRYVRGFGEMSWVTPGSYAASEADPVAPAEARIVEHMNDDHAGSLVEMVAAFLDVDGEVREARMLSCDRYGFEVQLTMAPGGQHDVAFGRIGFPQPLTAADEARGAMVDLVARARA